MLTDAWLWYIVNNHGGVMLPWTGGDGAEAWGWAGMFLLDVTCEMTLCSDVFCVLSWHMSFVKSWQKWFDSGSFWRICCK